MSLEPLFFVGSLHDFLTQRQEKIAQEIKAENEDSILTVDLVEYVAYFVEKFKLDPPVLHRPTLTQGVGRVMGREHPRGYDVVAAESYERQVVRYHYPVEGMIELLKYHPLRHTRVDLRGESGLDRTKGEVLFSCRQLRQHQRSRATLAGF